MVNKPHFLPFWGGTVNVKVPLLQYGLTLKKFSMQIDIDHLNVHTKFQVRSSLNMVAHQFLL